MRIKFVIALILGLYFWSPSAQISDFDDIDFTKAENTVAINDGKDLDNLPLLVHHLTANLSSDVEKFRAIYLWVCKNISGDPYQHRTVKIKRKEFKNDSLGYVSWNKEFATVALKKLWKHKKTMCTGYAYLIKEMTVMANIECEIVDGFARSFETNIEELNDFNHSWNAVRLNNKWYLCDATWSSGYMINGTIFAQDYNDGYFLTDPVLFAKNHFPRNKKWFLNDELEHRTFFPEPIVYGETFKHKILPITPKDLKTTVEKNQTVTFQFKTFNEISQEDVSLIKISGDLHKPIKIYDYKNEDGLITFNCKFKSKGSVDVHLKIKKDIVASYIIKVVKPAKTS